MGLSSLHIERGHENLAHASQTEGTKPLKISRSVPSRLVVPEWRKIILSLGIADLLEISHFNLLRSFNTFYTANMSTQAVEKKIAMQGVRINGKSIRCYSITYALTLCRQTMA